MTDWKLQYKLLKKKIIKKYFKKGCGVCGAKDHKRGMTIHHVEYIDNDVTYDMYPKTDQGKFQYLTDLEHKIKEDKSRFECLCNPHHQSVERLKRFNPQNFERLVKIVRRSR